MQTWLFWIPVISKWKLFPLDLPLSCLLSTISNHFWFPLESSTDCTLFNESIFHYLRHQTARQIMSSFDTFRYQVRIQHFTITFCKPDSTGIFVYWLPILSYFKRLESHTGRVHLSSCSIKQYMYLYFPLVDGTPFTGRIRQIDLTTFIVCVFVFLWWLFWIFNMHAQSASARSGTEIWEVWDL